MQLWYQLSKIMVTLSYFPLLFLFIPCAASITFNLTKISSQNTYRDINTTGYAYITNEGIQLTPNEKYVNSTAGRATYVKPLHLWDNTSGELASFATDFSFVIDSRKEETHADGLTFMLTEKNATIINGSSMGLPIQGYPNEVLNPFVAVVFHTFGNANWDPIDVNWDPTIGTLLGTHVGISINSLASVASQSWHHDIPGGRVSHAWITYDSILNNLTVSFTGFQDNITVIQTIYHIVDLKTVLPEWVIFGFSAANGAYFEKNMVRSWAFNSSELEAPPSRRPDQVNEKKGTGFVVKLIIGLSVMITFVAVVALCVWRKKVKSKEEEQGFHVGMNTEFEMEMGPRKFSYRKLARSTDGFAENKKLGEGGFGCVYKGFLKESSMNVAVKRVSKSSRQGVKEFASEVMIISKLRHKNLVQLAGWCHEKHKLLLVYEFMENGSLDLHLFKGKSLLAWGTRYKIAHGLASALLYLHEEWDQCVLHRDIKSSNIMLDSNFNAKLGDFGLAKLVDHEKGSHTTLLAGTLGYMAPECVVTGKASRESDVFSFGVVALEIACGRKPIEHKAQENQIRLVNWVWELYGTGTLLEAVDPRLGSDYEEEEIKRLMILGLWCVHPDSVIRPSMRQVIKVLNSEDLLPILPLEMPVASYLPSAKSSSKGVVSIIHNQTPSSTYYMGRS